MIQLPPQQDNDFIGGLLPDLTPLLDIIFIVLVFLLLCSNVPIKALPLDVPVVDKPPQTVSDDKALVVAVYQQPPLWGLDESRYDEWPQLQQLLSAQINEEAKVVIYADTQADVGHLMTVFNWLQQQQVASVQVVMKDK